MARPVERADATPRALAHRIVEGLGRVASTKQLGDFAVRLLFEPRAHVSHGRSFPLVVR
jgi:hypothetical protein